MKFVSALILGFFLAGVAFAQDAPSAPADQNWVSQSLNKTWELGVLAGGGTGLGNRAALNLFTAEGASVSFSRMTTCRDYFTAILSGQWT